MTNTLTQQLQEKAVREFLGEFVFSDGCVSEYSTKKMKKFITKLVADVVSEANIANEDHINKFECILGYLEAIRDGKKVDWGIVRGCIDEANEYLSTLTKPKEVQP